MSPKPVPITRGKRPATLHYARTEGLAFCGRRGAGVKFWRSTGEVVTCSTCIQIRRRVVDRDRARQMELQHLAAERDVRARLAYAVWSHRAFHGTPEAFDLLPNEQRQAWNEVVEYLEDEFHEEDVS